MSETVSRETSIIPADAANTDSVQVFEVGSKPLRKPAWEAYCRFRAMNFPPRLAAENAGFSPTDGWCTKLERKRVIQDRIAWFTREEEQLVRMKRARLESYYWKGLETDPACFYEVVDELVYDGDGNPIKRDDGYMTRKVQRLKNFDDIDPEIRQLVEGLTYTEKGKPNLKLVSKLAVSVELRKMLGGDAPARVDTRDLSLEALIMASYEREQGAA